MLPDNLAHDLGVQCNFSDAHLLLSRQVIHLIYLKGKLQQVCIMGGDVIDNFSNCAAEIG